MSLSKMSLRPLRLPQSIIFRSSSGLASRLPAPAVRQLDAPKESGFFTYARNWSRDSKYDLKQAPQKGDTPIYFMIRRLGHAYEVYPLIFLMGVWAALFTFACWFSFGKVEIWLDRSKDNAPWDWNRIRENYYKLNTVFGDIDGRTHQRLPIMEQLQDEMMAAARARGTRK